MKRKGNISDFFLKKNKQAAQVHTDPSPCVTTGPQSSSPPEASQSQCGQTSQGPSLPPLGQSIYQAVSHMPSSEFKFSFSFLQYMILSD